MTTMLLFERTTSSTNTEPISQQTENSEMLN